MGYTAQAQGVQQVVDRFQRAKITLSDFIEKNVRGLGETIVRKERQVLRVVRYTGELENSVSFEYSVSGTRFEMVIAPTSDHADVVRTGSRPHWVPIEPLKVWANWKLGDEGAAYAVQKSIANFGTSRYLAQRGVPFAEQTQYGIGLDYPSATLARGDVQNAIDQTANRIGFDIAAKLNGDE